MGTLWLETIFVSDVGDFISHTVRSNVPEGSTNSDGFVFSSNIVQLSLFLGGDAVAGLVSRHKSVFKKHLWKQIKLTPSWSRQFRCYRVHFLRWWRLCHLQLERQQPRRPRRRGRRPKKHKILVVSPKSPKARTGTINTNTINKRY